MARELWVQARSLQAGDMILNPDTAQPVKVTSVSRSYSNPKRAITYLYVNTPGCSTPVHPEEAFLLFDESDELAEQVDVLTSERDALLAKIEDILAERGIKVDF